MHLEDFLNANISKKMGIAIATMFFVKDIEDIYLACILTSIAAVGIICQTVIDVIKLEKGVE
jgi:hypothetical protein